MFSNGILARAGTAIFLIVTTQAKVDRLIPLYAIGVFTSFTLSQGGMAKHHITAKEPGWRRGLFVNGTGAVLSLVVDVIIAITKFRPSGAILGAWVIVVLVPVMVALLVRLNRQYEAEAAELEEDARAAASAPVLRRHVVLVLVHSLDRSAARAIQYARSLAPDELRAVHVAADLHHAEHLAADWRRLGLSRLPLELVDCPDRRIARSVLEVAAEAAADGSTEVTVLIPRLEHRRAWHKLLHDRTSDAIARSVSPPRQRDVRALPPRPGPAQRSPGAGGRRPWWGRPRRCHGRARDSLDQRGPPMSILTRPARRPRRRRTAGEAGAYEPGPAGTGPATARVTSIGDLVWRGRSVVEGRVRSVRVQPWGGAPTL
ncbi:MAG: hypothetical protein ABR511_10135 [Acidimicrobiales bacterium]